MRLWRPRSEPGVVIERPDGRFHRLLSDPLVDPPDRWRLGPEVPTPAAGSLAAPGRPGKIVGVGRSYAAHARELDNPVPEEPLLFLKAPSAVVGPGDLIRLPPESSRVEYEGEIAIVIGRRLSRAGVDEAQRAVLGATAANDVTARDLQGRDATFARAKSFDSFCPLGPAILIDPPLTRLEVATRLNGEERQRGRASELLWEIPEILAYISRMMTLEPGDLVLTGTPAGVGPLAPGDLVEVEVTGVGTLANPVSLI